MPTRHTCTESGNSPKVLRDRASSPSYLRMMSAFWSWNSRKPSKMMSPISPQKSKSREHHTTSRQSRNESLVQGLGATEQYGDRCPPALASTQAATSRCPQRSVRLHGSRAHLHRSILFFAACLGCDTADSRRRSRTPPVFHCRASASLARILY